MAFSNFKAFTDISKRYNIKIITEELVEKLMVIEPNPYFLEDLKMSQRFRKTASSEFFYCEHYIAPFLRYALRKYTEFNLWSHEITLSADENLNGMPDYVVSYVHNKSFEVFTPPYIAVAGAKKENFDEGWAQGLATALACQMENKHPEIPVYVIVTTGISWEIGFLKEKTLRKHAYSYNALTHPSEVLGLLDFVFNECDKNIKQAVEEGKIDAETNY